MDKKMTMVTASSSITDTISDVLFAPSSIDNLIAGVTAGGFATLVLHPFDLIKTRLQAASAKESLKYVSKISSASSSNADASSKLTSSSIIIDSSKSTSPSSPAKTTVSLIRQLLKDESPLSLYKGLTANLVGNTIAWGSYFYIYEITKRKLINWHSSFENGAKQLSAAEHMGAAAFTGLCVQAVTNPIWVVKTRAFLDYTPLPDFRTLTSAATTSSVPKNIASSNVTTQSPSSSAPRYVGFRSSIRTIYSTEGFLGFYRGFTASLLGISHGALQFMAYEEIKQWYIAKKMLKTAVSTSTIYQPTTPSVTVAQTPKMKPLETIAIAISSKVFSNVLTYPYQTIRSRMQSQHVHYRSIVDCISTTLRTEGVRALYAGVTLSTVKVIPNACIVFVTYEAMKDYLIRERSNLPVPAFR